MSFILLTCFLVLAALLSPRLVPDVAQTSNLYKADYAAFLQINNAHYKPFDQFMVILTNYGREVVWTMAGLLLVIFGGRTGRITVAVLAATILVMVLLGPLAKELVGRPRPIVPDNDVIIEADKEFAFPSGHALVVSAGAAVMLVMYRDSWKKRVISLGLATEAALVCFSRVYVGGHFPLDVVGGILLGVAVAFIFVGTKDEVKRLLKPILQTAKKWNTR